MKSTNDLYERTRLLMKSNCITIFQNTYHRDPDGVSFCPYRVCPLGAHVDHQHGQVNGLAINYGIHIAYSIKRNGVIELSSLEFPKRAQFHIAAVPWPKENDWADYLRGATKVLTDRYQLRYGLCGVIQAVSQSAVFPRLLPSPSHS